MNFVGKRYQIEGVEVFPKPLQEGGPPLWIAAMSEAGARRAARFGTHLLPQGAREEVLDPFNAAVTADGRDPADYRVGIARSILVTDDRERDWPRIRDAERYRMSVYQTYANETPDDYSVWREGAKAIPQVWIVGDADHCVAAIQRFVADYGVTDMVTSGLLPGLDPEFQGRNLERLARDVLPRVRAAAAA